MVTYGLPVVYALNINLINYGKNRFSLTMMMGIHIRRRVI